VRQRSNGTTLQELQHASEPCLPKAHSYKGMCNGHGKTTTARDGGGIGTCLCCQLTGHGGALNRVDVFKYLGRMMAQDDNHIQAVWHQLPKAQGTWARIGQVLRSENVTPWVAAKFYKAVVQAVLLYLCRPNI
jgi:hypothetical protein